MKIMLSQPMKNKTTEQIKAERQLLINKFNNMHIEVIDSWIEDDAPRNCHPGIYFLGKSLELLSQVDALYMCDGWEQARGCRLERQTALEYGIKILDDSFFINNINTNKLWR